MIIRFILLVFLVSLSTSACTIAEEKKDVHQKNMPAFHLPLDIKQVLKVEMQAIEKGMQKLVSTIAVGNWQKTAAIGKQIQASYIMKQSLTTEQMEYLHHSLPEQFIKLDRSFHHYAGMLAHAAEVKNAEVVSFYFYKMNDSCVQCHSTYAKGEFPGFSDGKESLHFH